MKTITIELRNGEVDVCDIPSGIKVLVHDYDVDGWGGDVKIKYDSDGVGYVETVYNDEQNSSSHLFWECDCGKTTCRICARKVKHCRVCNGSDGMLTTECCGRTLSENEEYEVYCDKLDFINGKWKRRKRVKIECTLRILKEDCYKEIKAIPDLIEKKSCELQKDLIAVVIAIEQLEKALEKLGGRKE